MERWVIDGFEGSLARLESPRREFLDVPRAWLPDHAREGDVLNVRMTGTHDQRTIEVTIDTQATLEQRERMKVLRESLRQAPAGDIDL